MTIQTPLQYAGVALDDNNRERWKNLSNSEKLFYNYVLENDVTLSSMMLGIFTAYLVNLISNLVTMKVTDLFMLVAYVLNIIFAFLTLHFLVKLYRIHFILDKQSENNAISIRVNKDFNFLYENQTSISRNVKSLKNSVILLFIMLLLCFGINNGLSYKIAILLEWIKLNFYKLKLNLLPSQTNV